MHTVQCLIPALLQAAAQLSAQLAKGFFVPLCTAAFAMLARIMVCTQSEVLIYSPGCRNLL